MTAMTAIEAAAKRAQEVFHATHLTVEGQWRAVAQAALAAFESHAEPVAWLVESKDTPWELLADATEIAKFECDDDFTVTPLYAHPAPEVSAREKMEDKIDGLTIELDEALRVLFRRGDDKAREWMGLNYPEMYAALAGKPDTAETVMNETQIKYMVDRFLGWKLPENFNPDGGISFKAAFNEHTAYPMKHEPSGTNLFDAVQAEAMVLYLIEGMPKPEETK